MVKRSKQVFKITLKYTNPISNKTVFKNESQINKDFGYIKLREFLNRSALQEIITNFIG